MPMATPVIILDTPTHMDTAAHILAVAMDTAIVEAIADRRSVVAAAIGAVALAAGAVKAQRAVSSDEAF